MAIQRKQGNEVPTITGILTYELSNFISFYIIIDHYNMSICCGLLPIWYCFILKRGCLLLGKQPRNRKTFSDLVPTSYLNIFNISSISERYSFYLPTYLFIVFLLTPAYRFYYLSSNRSRYIPPLYQKNWEWTCIPISLSTSPRRMNARDTGN